MISEVVAVFPWRTNENGAQYGAPRWLSAKQEGSVAMKNELRMDREREVRTTFRGYGRRL